ncbi:hypothetical protein T459_34495 [Capsicum annuum]|uniref:Uncharacterized protein n=1 Tax=Capsicum annuum TaxID=4072 RepID=A0A2G2XVX5_CAPAN|nr:hypothetical protein T459_34495 [Capsicum annuum]
MFLHGRDLSVPVLIRTIRRLRNEKVRMDFEVSIRLRNQVVERASAKEKDSILQAELDSQIRRLEIEKNELQSVVEKQIHGNLDLSHSVDLRKKLYVGRGGLLSHTTCILKRLRNTPSQNGADSQASYDGPENTDYEGDFEHVNEIGHSACFVENHDRAATLLENGKYQASENKGYAGHLELVNEVGHSACFDENHERSTHLSKNGKYQAKNTGYDGNFKLVNEVGDSARFEESFDESNNGDIEVTKCGREGSSHRDVEATEYDGEDSIIFHYGLFNDPKPTIEVKEKLEGQDNSIKFSSNSVHLSSYAHTTEKDGSVSSEPQRSSSSKELASKTKSSKSQSRPSTAGARATSATENTVRCSVAEVYNRWSTNERLNVADSPQVSEVTVHPSVELSDSSVPSSSLTSKTSKKTQSNQTVAPKRAQEKRLVSNSPRPRTSDCIKRNKDFKA